MRRAIAAVSGGPDSMALLDILNKQGKALAVCHVNYHHRPTAQRDEDIVRGYCQENHIPFHKLDAREPAAGLKCNFQAWAREVRYNFFKETGKKYDADTLYIAHNLDDLLETYQMQYERGITPETWGLASETQGYGFACILRPLLSKEKAELQEYCETNHIPYGIDESNLTNEYRRNQIRHSLIEGMSREEKEAMRKTIDSRNITRAKAREYYKSIYAENKGHIPAKHIADYVLLEDYIYTRTGQHSGMGKVKDLARCLKECGHAEFSNYILTLDDRLIQLHRYEKPMSSMRVETLPCIIPCQGMEKSISIETVRGAAPENMRRLAVAPEEMPLEIRTYNPDDKIRMRYGTKKISHIVRDKKVPKHMRAHVYVILNNRHEVIYSTISGCDKNHYNPDGGKVLCEVKVVE